MNNLIEKARTFWSQEQIRVLVLLSLMMQIILIVFAPRRRRSGNKLLLLLLWSVYLGTDYIATLALGSILTHTMDSAGIYLTKQNLPAFWAPFLLLHLGGPDNITSYSIQDNELWRRHLLGFVVQVSVAFMVLVQSNLQSTSLLVPTILVFCVGTVKFGERTFALHAATTEQIRHSLHDIFVTPTWILRLPFPVEYIADNILFIANCYDTFREIMPSLFNTVGKFPERSQIWEDSVFEVIGIHLCFFPDILHTKARFVHCYKGRWMRVVSFVLILAALCVFHVNDKWDQHSLDVIITYILLSMALILEIYSLPSIVQSWMLFRGYRRLRILGFIGRAKRCVCCYGNKWGLLKYIGQYNLRENMVETKYPSKIGRILILTKIARRFLFKEKLRAEVLDSLENMMISHVRSLVAGIDVPRDLARRLRSDWMANTLQLDDLRESMNQMRGKSFDECVMAWHLATEFGYFNDTEWHHPMKEAIYRLSGYIMHLMLEQPLMMPPRIAKQRLSDTMEHISELRQKIRNTEEGVRQIPESSFNMAPSGFLNRDSLSVCPLVWQLRRDLNNIGESSTRWEVISDAWMEMLTYAALRCSPTEHAKTVSRGGELLTYYWLLLLHARILEDFHYPSQQPTQPQNQSPSSATATTNSPLTPQITNATTDSLSSIEMHQITPSQPITSSLHPQSETTDNSETNDFPPGFGARRVAHHSTANAIPSGSPPNP